MPDEPDYLRQMDEEIASIYGQEKGFIGESKVEEPSASVEETRMKNVVLEDQQAAVADEQAQARSLEDQAAAEVAAENKAEKKKTGRHGIDKLDKLWSKRSAEGEGETFDEDIDDRPPFSYYDEESKQRNLDETEEAFQMIEDFLPPEAASNARLLRTSVEEIFGKDGYEKLAGAGLMKMFYEPGMPPGPDGDVSTPGLAYGLYSAKDRDAEFNIALLDTKDKVLRTFFHEIGVHHGIESFIDEVGGKGAFERFRQSFIDLLVLNDKTIETEFKMGGLFFGLQQSKQEITKSHNDFTRAYRRVMRDYVHDDGTLLLVI